MFEKEAEEYAHEHCCDSCKNLQARYRKVYQDGAEFAYNKANEWHKQDTDNIYDFIAEDWSVKYFICIMKDKRIVAAEGNCDEGYNGEVSVNLFFEHDDEKYHIDDIVWWKEIELPKESERND